MKTFLEFIKEQKLHRGHDLRHPAIGKQKIVWFAFDVSTAKEFADHREIPTISTIDYKPKKSVDLGKAERSITIASLCQEIVDQAHTPALDMGPVDEICARLKSEFGAKSYEIVHFWNNSDLISELVDSCGFDYILLVEQGNKTIGILRKYLI